MPGFVADKICEFEEARRMGNDVRMQSNFRNGAIKLFRSRLERVPTQDSG